jgi:hypothetical protein
VILLAQTDDFNDRRKRPTCVSGTGVHIVNWPRRSYGGQLNSHDESGEMHCSALCEKSRLGSVAGSFWRG